MQFNAIHYSTMYFHYKVYRGRKVLDNLDLANKKLSLKIFNGV